MYIFYCLLSGLLLDLLLLVNHFNLKSRNNMNISLRKASAIQNRILEAIREIKIETSIQLNEFQDAETMLNQASETLWENDQRRNLLLLSLYNIRGLVGAANNASGVDLALSKAAFIDKRIVQLSEFASLSPVDSIDVINGRLAKIKEGDQSQRRNIYGNPDTVQTSVITSLRLSKIKSEILYLKKEKQKLNDEILELNIKTEIPLADETVKVLKDEGLI